MSARMKAGIARNCLNKVGSVLCIRKTTLYDKKFFDNIFYFYLIGCLGTRGKLTILLFVMIVLIRVLRNGLFVWIKRLVLILIKQEKKFWQKQFLNNKDDLKNSQKPKIRFYSISLFGYCRHIKTIKSFKLILI